MKRWRTSEMSAVAQQTHPWGIACGVLFDFLCEDGFLVVFCCCLLPLLSPGCVGGWVGDKLPLFSVAKRKEKGLRGPWAGSTGLAGDERGGGGRGRGRVGGEKRSCKAKVITEADQLQSIKQYR